MAKEQNRHAIFDNTLRLLQLETQKFDTMLLLVESLAWKFLKEDVSPRAPTVHERENLMEYVPWTFVPNVADFTASQLKFLNGTKYAQLKNHIKAIKEILADTEVVP